MKLKFFVVLQSVLFFALVSFSAFAADATPSEEGWKYSKMYVDNAVNEDGTEDRRYEISMTVLREDAVQGMKEYSISHSTSAEKVEVLEAYTQKPDGRKIESLKNNFQITASGGRQGAAPAFSDSTTLTIVFPDVEVGDTVTLVYKSSIIDPLFPRQFSSWYTFPESMLYDDARISFSIPLSLKARYKNFGLIEKVNKEENGRQLLTWTHQNKKADKTEYAESPIWPVGHSPGLIISTFPSYRTIAESYGTRAKPKAAVTQKIQGLADKITAGITTPREQAKALYDWVVANLTYAGNCIGVGAVVPRDLDFVLANKMGDCKDHATLLQSLLAAKGIKSTQALIGSNSTYTLPDVPLVEVINHVINYLPDMDLFLDATSGESFGYLPNSLYAKPVLLVDGYKEGTKTPPLSKNNITRVRVTSKTTINDDGVAEGVTSIVYTSPMFITHNFLQYIKNTTQKQLDDQGKSLLTGSGYEGSVTVSRAVIDEKKLTYSYDVHFKLKDYVYPGTPGAISIEAPFALGQSRSVIAQVKSNMTRTKNEKVDYDFSCDASFIEENYEYTIPKNMQVLAIPNSFSASTSVQEYTSNYSQSGQTITISRRLDNHSPAPVCSPHVEEEYRDLAVKAWPDLRSMIVYK